MRRGTTTKNDSEGQGHQFQLVTFQVPIQCVLCGMSIWGLGNNGYECTVCHAAVHRRCLPDVQSLCSYRVRDLTKERADAAPRRFSVGNWLKEKLDKDPTPTSPKDKYKDKEKEKDRDKDKDRSPPRDDRDRTSSFTRFFRKDKSPRPSDHSDAVISPKSTPPLELANRPGSNKGSRITSNVVPASSPTSNSPSSGSVLAWDRDDTGSGKGALTRAVPVIERIEDSPSRMRRQSFLFSVNQGRQLDSIFVGPRKTASETSVPNVNNSPTEKVTISPRPSSMISLSPDERNECLENLSLEARRLCIKNALAGGFVRLYAKEKSTLESELEQQAKADDNLHFQILDLEESVGRWDRELRLGSSCVFRELDTVFAGLNACSRRFESLCDSCRSSPPSVVQFKQLTALEVLGHKLEELLNCQSLLREYNAQLVKRRETQKKQLWNQSQRVAELQSGLDLLKESVLALRKDREQIAVIGRTVAELDNQMTSLQPADLPDLEVQTLLHTINLAVNSLSSPIPTIDQSIGVLPSPPTPTSSMTDMRASPQRLIDKEEDTVDMCFTLFPDGSRGLKAATPDRLVERLTSEKSTVEWQRKFLLSFPQFMRPIELLEKLILRFCVTPVLRRPEYLHEARAKQDMIRARVLAVLRAWIEDYWSDFEADSLPDILVGFIEGTAKPLGHHKPAIESLQTLLNRRMRATPARRSRSSFLFLPSANANAANVSPIPLEMPTPILPKDLAKFSFKDLSPVEIARQITIEEAYLFSEIGGREFLGRHWTKADKGLLAPNVIAVLEHSQLLSTFVSSTLLAEKELSERQSVLATFIATAYECFSHLNFHGCGIILEALEHPSIFRLKNTWDGVDLKNYNTLKMHYEDNYRKLRQAIAQIAPPTPCIPYLGMLLSDLNEVETGTPKYVRGKLVNFYKLDLQAQVILQAQVFQATKYAFRRVDPICDYLFDPKRTLPGDAHAESRGLEQSISTLI